MTSTGGDGERGGGRVCIGVLCDEIANPYSEPILDELFDAAREHGVSLLNLVGRVSLADLQARRPNVTNLAGRDSVDAVLVLPIGYELSPTDLEEYFQRFQPLPVCSIPDVAGDQASRILVDNGPGLDAAITHLIEVHGHRRLAFVRGPSGSEEAGLRYQVYREVLHRYDIPYDEGLVAPGEYLVQSGVAAVQLLLEERRSTPDAIICANDSMALGALEALNLRGYAVPEDIALIGFDDVELVRYVDPPLTTVRQPLRELARSALQLLLEQLRTGGPAKRVSLPCELVVRESCGCLPYGTRGNGLSSRPYPRRAPGVPGLMRKAGSASEAIRELGIAGAPNYEWEEALYDAFIADLSGQSGFFLRGLRSVLESVASAQADVGAFHKVITLLWQFARKSLSPSSPEWKQADALLHAARVKVSGVAERVPSRRQVRLVDAAYKFAQASGALASAVDYPSAGRVLSQHLPLQGIYECYICLYDTDDSCRLVAGFCGTEIVSVERRFERAKVLPDGIGRGRTPVHYVVGPLSRTTESPGYVVFGRGPQVGFVYENLIVELSALTTRLRLMEELLREATLREQAERERMQKELSIATHIQTGILPQDPRVVGLDIAGMMLPATEVGGDYYDVVSVEDGCWIGIGDVAGHGLTAGLVMLMLQSVVSGLVRANPKALPTELLTTINAVLFENIRHRMAQLEYITFTLLHYEHSGRLSYAGAHVDLLIRRAHDGTVERLHAPGTWLAATNDLTESLELAETKLSPGDVLLLYTDGVTEARNQDGELYGSTRLATQLAKSAADGSSAIRDELLAHVTAWMDHQEDDMTLVVVTRPLASTDST